MAEFDPVAYINEPRWQEVKPGLERIADLLDRMGRPQDRLKFVHVAGTNGKGSTCAYIAGILQAAGYRTGLFTSPYIIDFEERIRVNGQNIPTDDLRDVTLYVREHAEAMAAESGEHPTEFELMTAVAFEHFARSKCDIVVCEVGLGGRLDSTNIIEAPEVCVITRLGLDHTGFLGDTLEAIAHEKAGIIKPGATVVAWPQEDEAAMRVIRDKAASCGCDLVVPDFDGLLISPVDENGVRRFHYDGRVFFTRLLASYQPSNAALAIEAADALRNRGWNIAYDPDMTGGIYQTAWPGRFEVVSTEKPVWYKGIKYSDEMRRGFDCREDLFVPGSFELELKSGESVVFSANADAPVAKAGLKRRFESMVSKIGPITSFHDQLVRQADLLIRIRKGRKRIVAGYSWLLTGLLRETLYSLAGLTLYGKNDPKEFEEILMIRSLLFRSLQ